MLYSPKGVYQMNLEEFEELLEEVFPDNNFQIETDINNQLIVKTRLQQDDDGELIDFVDEDDEEEEEDLDVDPDFEPLEDEDADDE
jgi:hypothetical protein